MPATREQLTTRWETEEGKQLASEVQQALNPARDRRLTSEIRVPLTNELRQRLVMLPFADEVAHRIDLRGVHTSRDDLFLIQVDLAGTHLEYAELALIRDSKLDEAILDSCRAINSRMYGDLSRVSLVDAVLNGVQFLQVNLSGAQLQGAHLVKAELREAICTGASFLAADLRFSDCRRVDFRGADLREIDLTQASLEEVQFDEHTRLRGANLQGANMHAEFRAFAQQAGALLGDAHKARSFVELDVTIKMLQESENSRILAAIPIIVAVRAELARDPQRDWPDTIAEALSQAGYADLEDEVFETWGDSSKAMGYYI